MNWSTTWTNPRISWFSKKNSLLPAPITQFESPYETDLAEQTSFAWRQYEFQRRTTIPYKLNRNLPPNYLIAIHFFRRLRSDKPPKPAKNRKEMNYNCKLKSRKEKRKERSVIEWVAELGICMERRKKRIGSVYKKAQGANNTFYFGASSLDPILR